MVLRADVGEQVERYLLIKNTNDVPVRIELEASGDLEEYLKIKDNNFTIQPGDEKKAYFTIKSPEAGMSETKIKVLFIPETGSSVGLGSTVIFIAGDSTTDYIPDENPADSEDNVTTNSSNPFSFKPKPGSGTAQSNFNLNISPIILLTILTAVLVLVFIILIIFLSKKKKGVRRKK